MTVVHFIGHDGRVHTVRAETGTNLMRVAVDGGIPGITGECGGSGVCATCHCYVDEAWLARLDPPSDFEAQLLEAVGDPRPNSRLGCQVTLDERCDGIVVRLPDTQC
jgi:ferredoxin, 2Fe-2S